MGQQKSKIISGEPEQTKTEKIKPKKGKKVVLDETPKDIKKIEQKKVKTAKTEASPSEKIKIRSKKYQEAKKQLEITPTKSIKEVIEAIKKIPKSNFNASFELHVALNLKPKQKLKGLRIDQNNVIHTKIGKISDKTEKIVKNFEDITSQIVKTSGRKDFIKSIAVCSTMSPAVKINIGDKQGDKEIR